MRALLVPVLVLLLAAPAAGQSPSPPIAPRSTPDRSIRDGSAQRELDRARRRWRRAGIHNYRFSLSRQCFCPPVSWVLFVRDDKPAGAPAEARKLATARRLHRRVQQAIDDRVAGLTVRYDRRGMPRSLHIDGRQNVADDEVGYTVDGFWRGTRGRGGPDRPGEQ